MTETIEARLKAAREDLATLESGTATLEAGVKRQEANLNATRKAARAGQETFEAVVLVQSRFEAARGLLAQHLQETADATALASELEEAAKASGTLAGGRAAFKVREARTEALKAKAEEIESYLRKSLGDLKRLEVEASTAERELKGHLVSAVKQAFPQVDISRLYMMGRPFASSDPQTVGDEWLQSIDAGLTDAFAIQESVFDPRPFPLLTALSGRY